MNVWLQSKICAESERDWLDKQGERRIARAQATVGMKSVPKDNLDKNTIAWRVLTCLRTAYPNGMIIDQLTEALALKRAQVHSCLHNTLMEREYVRAVKLLGAEFNKGRGRPPSCYTAIIQD